MPALTSIELTVLAAFMSLLLLAVSAVVLLLRSVVRRIENISATYEILRQHPDLADDLTWTPWTGSVNLTPGHRALPPVTPHRAA